MKYKLGNIILIILISLAGNYVVAQEGMEITGIIRGINNNPVPDVSVSVEGVVLSPEVTDSTGHFSIMVPDKNAILILTPPGSYKARTYYLGGRITVEIKLTSSDLPDSREQKKHVFGYQRQRDFISAADFLQTDIIQNTPYQSVNEYFNGNIAGVWNIGRSGMPGSGSVNYIRGIHSMNANTQPLYVIDGLPLEIHGIMGAKLDGFSYNPLSGLNPFDISDLTVIKDNAAANLFGVRGSNGIVLIETLKPTSVQTTIDVSYRTGISTAPDHIPQLNSEQYRTYAKEVLMSSRFNAEDFPLMYPGLYLKESDDKGIIYNNNTNWQDIIFRNAIMNDLYFRINGGDEIAKYGLSIGYQDNQGIIKNTAFNRFSVRFVGSFNMFDWLKFNISSNLSNNTSQLKESARSYETSPILSSLLKNPLMIPYEFDSEGNQLSVREDVDELGVSNPLSTIEGFKAVNKNYRFLTTLRIGAEITNHLSVNSLVGINFNSLNEKIFKPNLGMERYYDDEAYNVSSALSNNLYSFANDNYINYQRDIGTDHTIQANAGMRINTSKFQYDWGIAKNSHENDEFTTLQSGTSILQELGGNNGNWNRLAFYGNIKYTLLERYGLTLNASAENSTRIGPRASNVMRISEVPFGIFYGTGLFWRISNEPFLRNTNWIDELKLSVSYGKSGNDDIGNYDAFNYFYLVHYRNTTGMVPGPMTNESLSFEEYYHLNSGMDFTTWGNRLSISVDLFRNRTSNLLVYKIQEFYKGHERIPVNDGEMVNTGWEASIFSRPIETKQFSLDIGISLSHFSNEVQYIANDQLVTPFLGGQYISEAGSSLLSFYGYRYQGVFSTSVEALEADLVNDNGIPFGAGDAKYEDISGPAGEPDGIIDDFDKTIIGSPIPDYYGALNTRIRYKRWTLDIQFQGVYGNEVFNYLRSVNESMTHIYNQSIATLNRWQYEGQETEVPRSLWDDPVGNAAFSSRWIEDGSYFRLKNVTLGYRIPSSFLVFRNAEFYLSGTNIFTATNYLGLDPEFAISYKTMEQGIDYGSTPSTRTFLVGIKFGL